MNKSYEVEYCNLELRFSRLRIQQLIKDLIQEGYSLYWSEDEDYFILSVRTGRKLVKLKFQQMRTGDYKLIGDYIIKDAKLAEYMEKLIGDTRGHAVVRRFKDHIIVIENILFGEVIRLVEVSGFKQKVIYQKGPAPTLEEMEEMYTSIEGELRLTLLRMEIDDELERLYEAIGASDTTRADKCRAKLFQMQDRMLMLEW
ncbi:MULTISPECIES: hypothetical protein [unclassified Paenibacillus]|uniref:CYTH domain-containing protein n=1 Tax=Paenibacillus provencensis TaxID=441151 RepID=A0ABW3PQZ4_9BACL|nr:MULTISPECIES: hypothetical protein [unclassified Paenibacillus]MCM3126315.1 hypothetical protein [Paenibacillus sp. MER 78]SFS60935.1 hypothetical protein SAMN04488601_1012529 [Paenibacillus sp. 453mf]